MVVEHHAARLDCELRTQFGAALRLQRRLLQQIPAAGKGTEDLVVEVVAVCQHDDSGILHRRFVHDAPGIERHGQALARALGVPDGPDVPVAPSGLVAECGDPLQFRRPQGFGDRSNAPASVTWSCGIVGSATVSPAIMRHGLNHSYPAVSVPIRSSVPSETTSAALKANSDGSSVF